MFNRIGLLPPARYGGGYGGSQPSPMPAGTVGGGPIGAPAPQGGGMPSSNPFSGLWNKTPSADEQRKKALDDAARAAGGFAGQGEAGYGGMTAEMAKDREALRALASGQNSIAAEQLRQGTQQQIAAQRAMAASASPQNAAMAARTAMNNAGRAQYGMSGQAALAGIAERNAATEALARMNLGQRGQDIEVGLGSRGNQMTGLGANKADKPKEPSKWEKALAAGGAALATFSDERLKEDVEDGDAAARKAIEALGAKTYRYKDPKYGAGKQIGIMAQALERAGLKQAVIDTPEGKALDTGKLTGANTALIASLGKRMSRLEKGR